MATDVPHRHATRFLPKALGNRLYGSLSRTFGISPDPRAHVPGDPALSSYEELLPGMTPVVWLKDDQLAWLADLQAKGYDVPPGANEVFRPKADFPGAAGRGPTFAPTR